MKQGDITSAVINNQHEVALLLHKDELHFKNPISSYYLKEDMVYLSDNTSEHPFRLGNMAIKSLVLSGVLKIFELDDQGEPISLHIPDLNTCN